MGHNNMQKISFGPHFVGIIILLMLRSNIHMSSSCYDQH